MVNALSGVKSIEALEIHLQTNEVLVYAPRDTDLTLLSSRIHEAGFQADDKVWMLARGQWGSDGFLPAGWSHPLGYGALQPDAREAGNWELTFQKKEGGWQLIKAEPVTELPHVGK